MGFIGLLSSGWKEFIVFISSNIFSPPIFKSYFGRTIIWTILDLFILFSRFHKLFHIVYISVCIALWVISLGAFFIHSVILLLSYLIPNVLFTFLISFITYSTFRNPLHYSYLENPMDRGVWQAIVYEVTRVRCDLTTKQPQHLEFLFYSFPAFWFIFNS